MVFIFKSHFSKSLNSPDYSSLIKYGKVLFLLMFMWAVVDQDSVQGTNPKLRTEVADTAEVSIEEIRKQIHENEYPRAFELFDLFFENRKQIRPKPVFLYIDLVARTESRDYYEKATQRFMLSLSGKKFSDKDSLALIEEMKMLRIITDEKTGRQLEDAAEKGVNRLAEQIRMIWTELDPTPVSPVNERMIEHRSRVQKAKTLFPGENSDTGLDDRGEIWVRYGEPDVVYDKPITITRGDLYSFVSEFQYLSAGVPELSPYGTVRRSGSSTESSSEEGEDQTSLSTKELINTQKQSYQIVNRLEEVMAYDPYATSFIIWIYRDIHSSSQDNLIFYFISNGENEYREVDSVDDWIPASYYNSSRRKSGIPFSPALALQYITYRRIMDIDKQFRDYWNRLERELFQNPHRHTPEQFQHLATRIRSENRSDTYLVQANTPVQKSTDLENIYEIPIDIHQYQMLNNRNEPVFTTFIESKAGQPFLTDFLNTREQIFGDEISHEEALQKLADWYRFEQGVELYDSNMQLLGRFRGYPTLEVDAEANTPSTLLLDIPVPADSVKQIFYSRFENKHPESEMDSTRFFPSELRGIGKEIRRQPDHFYEYQYKGLMLGDLIIGYRRLNDEVARFPFFVSHDRKIPENENLVVHFEVYSLHAGTDSLAEFEVQYELIPENKKRFLFWSKTEDITGTLHFSTDRSQFRESLEFENLPLDKGSYTLNWTVQQKGGEISVTRTAEIKVVENGQLFSSKEDG